MSDKAKIYIYAGIAIAILILAFSAYKACRITDELSKLKGQYDILKKQAEESEAEFAKRITEYEKEIDLKDKEIAEQKKIVEDKNKNITNNAAKIKALEADREKLKDKDAIISNLDSQVNYWKEQFSLRQDIIVSKDAIIFSLAEKYETQCKLTEGYKLSWENEKALRELAEKDWKLAERKLVAARFWSNIKTASIVGIACYVIVSSISK